MRTGGCQCGKVRFSSEGAVLALYICHCRECQKQSASAFGMSLQVPAVRTASNQRGAQILVSRDRSWRPPELRLLRRLRLTLVARECRTGASWSQTVSGRASVRWGEGLPPHRFAGGAAGSASDRKSCCEGLPVLRTECGGSGMSLPPDAAPPGDFLDHHIAWVSRIAWRMRRLGDRFALPDQLRRFLRPCG